MMTEYSFPGGGEGGFVVTEYSLSGESGGEFDVG